MGKTAFYTEDAWKITLSDSGDDDTGTVDDLKELMTFLILGQLRKTEEGIHWR